ncbi:MAG: DotA/TraY family protein [Gammaproteobacteria bacterium]|nr:DotA/TraY family protein [Gammaproteobacteria bacterium]
MISIFDIPATDQSIYYLGQVFGRVGNILPVVKAPMLLGVMFKTFNTLVLAVAALIVLYVTIVGVLKTAAEGEFLGRQWSSIWVPLRMVLGIAALVPTPSGYSSIQILMMWIVMQGIGAADLVWNTVLKYTQVMGSPFATVSVPTVGVSADMENLFQALVCQATAKAPYDYTMQRGTTRGSYYCGIKGNQETSFCQAPANDLLNISGSQTTRKAIASTNTTQSKSASSSKQNYIIQYPIGPGGFCGVLQYCDADKMCSTGTLDGKIACDTCKSQATNLQAIVTTLGQIADQFVQADYQYRVFYDKGGKAPDWVGNFCAANNLQGPTKCCRTITTWIANLKLPDNLKSCGINDSYNSGDENNASDEVVNKIYWPYYIKANVTGDIDFVEASVDRYISGLNDAVLNVIQGQINNADITSGTTLDEANQVGWIFAGAYYYYLAQQGNKNVDASMPYLTMVPNNPRGSPESNVLFNKRNNFEAAGALLAQSGFGSQSKFTMSISPKLKDLGKLAKGMESSVKSVMTGFMGLIGGKPGELATNPLAKLQTLGFILLVVAQILFFLVIYITTGLALLGYFSAYALGTGFDNPVGGTVTTFAIILGPILAMFLGALFTFGALLAVYTPLIPYIIFTVGAISWFLLVIEAMIASPLIALGILLPGGQSEILGKAEHALGYAFGIFLRPALMVFGMMAAMLLANVVVTMINAGFVGVMSQMYANAGLVEELLFLGAYTGIVLTALNKCFSLIHVIPDRVLRWMGGSTEETGAAAGEGLSGAKGGVSQAAKGAQTIGGGISKRSQSANKDLAERAQKKKGAGKESDDIQISDSDKGGGEK